ncbi:MAG: homoserine O-acetyltransferase MetX [Terriglobales bacterium]
MTNVEPTHEATLPIGTLALDSGGELAQAEIHYAVYGEPNELRDNVILVCHALSGSARVADWWPQLFPAVFDTSRFCVIGSNLIGSCYGSTGPSSLDPVTGITYGPDFPLVSVRDMVRAQARVLDRLGIERLHTVVGGSIGGMQALQWAVDFPLRVERCIAIGAASIGAMALALNHLQRQAIQLDPAWHNGRYAPGEGPAGGLGLARAIAMLSYKSAELFAQRFARRPNRNGEDPYHTFQERFDVAGYLDHQGEKFNARFDANSYLVLSKAMDTFHLERGYESEHEALRRIRARVLLVGISSDWLFPPEDVRDLAQRIRAAGRTCDYAELKSTHGHDGFLADMDLLTPFLTAAIWRPAASAVSIARPRLARSANL